MTHKTFLFCILLLISASAYAGVNSQLRQGGNYYNQKKYGSALGAYQEILKQHPKDQNAWFNAGNAYYRLNEYTQAQEAYKQAAGLTGPQAENALFNLGNAYYRAGDKQNAIEQYKAAILANPADKEAIHNLQLLLEDEQQQKKNDQNKDNQSNKSDNQDQKQDKNQGQAPQQNAQQNQTGQLSQSDADRVMAMAKEKEYKRAAGTQYPDQQLEKDW